MPGQNEGEQQDFLYKRYGLVGYIVFLLTAFISLIVALDIENYFNPLIVISALSFCIAVVFCVCISRVESKMSYRRVRGEEPAFEEIELNEMTVSRREDPRRRSIDHIRGLFGLPPFQTDSEESSKSEDDPDVQETLALMKLKEATKTSEIAVESNPASTSREDESCIVTTVADVYAETQTKQGPSGASSDQIADTEKEAKVFRLSQIPFIDSDDAESGIIQTVERSLSLVTQSVDSTYEADPAENVVSEKET
ncbi:hypothetical protein TNIN_147361 [Trichonephila inaurata madagascariensis]|uniref:Uncharacterized protein n=1 Tax=Trichonephila inaurata madagascariensis TaxID=2747483 RepID=A0A8X7CLL0_9ARAC|nr:hypothetical protein TNIN_147361 [Trichonephila inaurata madagascariensis]